MKVVVDISKPIGKMISQSGLMNTASQSRRFAGSVESAMAEIATQTDRVPYSDVPQMSKDAGLLVGLLVLTISSNLLPSDLNGVKAALSSIGDLAAKYLNSRTVSVTVSSGDTSIGGEATNIEDLERVLDIGVSALNRIGHGQDSKITIVPG